MARLLDNLPVLDKVLSRRPSGLITDIDGTISPTSADPLHVTIPAANRLLLKQLSNKIELVCVISGRATDEVRRLVDGEKIVCIGHYGMERWIGDHSVIDPRVAPYVPCIRATANEIIKLEKIPGIVIQDKGLTLSIHYRKSAHPEKTRKEIAGFLRASPHVSQLRVLEEKKVVGIIPPVRLNKGTAVKDLVKQFNLRSGIYMGDDVADILAFRAVHRANRHLNFTGLAIAVTGKETPSEVIAEADFALEGVGETETLLKYLISNV